MKLTLEKACSKYGAQMGRCNDLPVDPEAPIKLRLERLRLQDGDYDTGGAYWGYTPGSAIYCAWGEDNEGGVQVRVFTRANSRDSAKQNVKELLPRATFWR